MMRPARQAADAEREVEAERAGRDHLDLLVAGTRAHAHDRALAEGPLDLRERGVERLVLFHRNLVLMSLFEPGIRPRHRRPRNLRH